MPGGGRWLLVGRHVAPFVHRREMGETRHVRRVNRQIECETKAFEILFHMVVCRITAIEETMSGELLAEQQLESRPDLGGDDLRGFGRDRGRSLGSVR